MKIKNLIPLIVTCVLTLLAGSVWSDSRCTERKPVWWRVGKISCSYQEIKIPSSAETTRSVKYELPLGEPPAGGWPVVIIFQGSFFSVEFSRISTLPFGGYNEIKVIRNLLANGYAVIAPQAVVNSAWHTNTVALLMPYKKTTDYKFLTNLFEAIEEGTFGPLNADKKFATGISSGGYNTSRMAVSFAGEFKALAIQSGAYATCAGPVCILPDDLPEDHPPTLFLHGFLDPAVPWYTMDLYYDRLNWMGIETKRITSLFTGHAWLKEAPSEMVEWFNQYL